MPRLSIIVPCVNRLAELEDTLVSVLENRPRDCEILVVHDGSYDDPYDLGGDEVELVVSEESSVVGMIQAGACAAHAGIVQVLLPGMVVPAGWTDGVLSTFQEAEVASVSSGIDSISDQAAAYGIDAQWLPRRTVIHRVRAHREVAPLIAGSFFRRRVLLALDGFYPFPSLEASEVEFGLALKALGYRHEVLDANPVVQAPSLESTANYASGFTAGQLSLAYRDIVPHDAASGSFIARISHLAGGLLSPASVAERLGWVLGVKDRGLVRPIADRIATAEHRLGLSQASEQAAPQKRRVA